MTKLTESDWELINAYADGELSASETKLVSRRLAYDADLAAALTEVHTTKAALSLIRPLDQPEPERFGGSMVRRLALAGSVAAALALGAFAQFGSFTEDWRDIPTNLHTALSAKAYVLAEKAVLPVVSTARMGDVHAFDLSSSRLTLVDVQTTSRDRRDVVAMHYRGRNGCRLTVIAIETMTGDPVDLPARHEGLGARWTVGPVHFYLLASGMDNDRFDAIATYAKSESRRLNGDAKLRMAMHEATAQARPCA